MDRRALVLYLENVRDLEAICYRIRSMYQKEKDDYEMDRFQHPTQVEHRGHRNVKPVGHLAVLGLALILPDRKSTRLNSSHAR